MTALETIIQIYRELISHNGKGGIPVDIRTKANAASQDDPFHHWIENQIRIACPKEYFDIVPSGSLTTPDIVIRDRRSGTIVGIETKKLVQKANGSDSRGLTIDYNSCLPCGKALVKVGPDTIEIPCFYLFALLDRSSSHIVTMIIVDGDFLNYDLDQHKESKHANFTEYNHGPYGEGSVRHRRMYTYPNPLNTKITHFLGRQILIAKKNDLELLGEDTHITDQIIREDRYGYAFYYLLKDEVRPQKEKSGSIGELRDIFASCKIRKPKDRTPSIPALPTLK